MSFQPKGKNGFEIVVLVAKLAEITNSLILSVVTSQKLN